MTKNLPVDLPGVRIITVSGRIGCGASTLGENLARKLNWKVTDGGKLFREFGKDHGYAKDRPDDIDRLYDGKFKNIIQNESHQIVESHLSGFLAQGVDNVFKIFVLCQDDNSNDQPEVRASRVANRHGMSIEAAMHEIRERERQHLEKFRRLYAPDDSQWIYWNKKYYDLVINTYTHNAQQVLDIVLQTFKIHY